MNRIIFEFLKKQSFQPGILSVFINPFFLIRRPLFKAISFNVKGLKGRLLDFGCGRKPYRDLFEVSEYIGVDIEQTGHNHTQSLVDVYYDGKTLPFPNDHFDSIFCSEVIEHVFEPDKILPELYRTAKPGAKLFFTVPFCWNEHETPYDYARYSSFGMEHLFRKNGFNVINVSKTGNFVRVIAQLIALYWFELFNRWGKVGYAFSLLLIAPINLLTCIIAPIFPKNQSMYFNTIIIAEKANI